MKRVCSHSNSLGYNSCNQPYNLGKVIFNDPFSEKPDSTYLCIEHSNHVIDKLFDSINAITKRVDYIQAKLDADKKIPDYVMGADEKLYKKRQADSSGQKARERENIQKLKKIKNDMMWNTCRHPLCGKHFDDREPIYSAVFFTPRGKMRKTVYLHRDCWVKVKGMVGIIQPIQQGQFTLDTLITN